MNETYARARVTLRRRRLWRIRLGLGLTRWVLYLVAITGIVATARNAVEPTVRRTVAISTKPASDARLAWFAVSFARAYFTWAPDPLVHQGDLAVFVASTEDQDVGLIPSPASAQRVAWAAVAAESTGPASIHDYTVAVATGRGTQYLAVAVARGTGGRAFLARYPALVGAPGNAKAVNLDGGSLPAVTNGAASAVLERALPNYVDGSAENLSADLAPRALVQQAAAGLTLHSILRLALEPSGSVLATVRAADLQGDTFTLAYQVSLVESHGRWEIARIGP
jgi:hypothetical protein